MIVELDEASPVPPYEQIRAQIAAMIGSGALPAGTRLPPIRQLAGDLGLAVNTVARAYRELEGGKLVTSRVRTGTVVAPRSPQEPDERTAADTRADRGGAFVRGHHPAARNRRPRRPRRDHRGAAWRLAGMTPSAGS